MSDIVFLLDCGSHGRLDSVAPHIGYQINAIVENGFSELRIGWADASSSPETQDTQAFV